jgi:hypothetical protein
MSVPRAAAAVWVGNKRPTTRCGPGAFCGRGLHSVGISGQTPENRIAINNRNPLESRRIDASGPGYSTKRRGEERRGESIHSPPNTASLTPHVDVGKLLHRQNVPDPPREARPGLACSRLVPPGSAGRRGAPCLGRPHRAAQSPPLSCWKIAALGGLGGR